MTDQELLQRNDLWERAIRDRDQVAAKSVLAEDYALVLVHPAPAVLHREDWLAMLPDYVVHGWTVEERVVDVAGDVAAILQRVSMQATVQDRQERSFRHQRCVEADRWRMESVASTLNSIHGR